jgi:hypothetical protein
MGFGEKLWVAIARATMTGMVASTETQKGYEGKLGRGAVEGHVCLGPGPLGGAVFIFTPDGSKTKAPPGLLARLVEGSREHCRDHSGARHPGDAVSARRSVPACLLGLLLAGCVTALPGEELADAARVRVTIDPHLARDCVFLGMASDTSETDLQRKAAWLGGDVAVVTLASQEARAETSWYKAVTTTAEVFRCEETR